MGYFEREKRDRVRARRSRRLGFQRGRDSLIRKVWLRGGWSERCGRKLDGADDDIIDMVVFLSMAPTLTRADRFTF